MHSSKAWLGLVLLIFGVGISIAPHSVLAQEAEESLSTKGYPAHYFVFDYLPGRSILPKSYQLVGMAYPVQSISEEHLEAALNQADRNKTQLVVLVQDRKGSTVFRDVVSFSPWRRGEFQTDSGNNIDSHLIQPEHSFFVVRLPNLSTGRLVFQDDERKILAEYDLAKLIAQTRHVRSMEFPAVVNQQVNSGSPANRVDLVVVGDGYTSAQAADFTADAAAVISDFFSISPLEEYANYYNVYTLMVASPQSGADHPPYDANCSYYDPTCCGDPAMLSDPLRGQMVATAFDSRFCAYRIHRLLVADDGKVMEAVGASIPEWDQILVIVNDETYGGSGGTIAVVSMNYAAVEVAQHEYGHSFVNLADEYESAYPGYPPCSDVPGSPYSPCEANVTDLTLREQIKWHPWILESTPIPTPETQTYAGIVGLFEGGRYQSTGMYRSGLSCIMRALGEPFCQVPSQEYVLTLYRGGWGTPYAGISLIEPGSSLPITPTLSLTHPATQVFSAALLSPIGGPPLGVTWWDNGEPIQGASIEVLTYTTQSNGAGLHEITLQVKDTTSLVNPQMDEGELEMQHSWVVEISVPMTVSIGAEPVAIQANGVSTATITATVMSVDGPVAGDVVTFTTTSGEVSPMRVTTDITGKATTVLTSSWEAGFATITVGLHGYSDSVQVEFVGLPKFFLPVISKV